jgi:hypothetical protein
VRAEIVVITNIDNPVTAMTKTEIQSIFMGRKRAFANGLKAKAFDFSELREPFYSLLTHRSMSTSTAICSL